MKLIRKKHKMMFGLWVGFMGLAGAMAIMFWMVLHFSVQGKYQEQAENDLKAAAQSIWDMYDQEDFEANIAFLAKTNDYFVQIVSEKDMQVLLSVNNQGENAAPQQDDIVDETLFQRLDESDGICQYYVKDDVRISNWVVQAVVLANIGKQITGRCGCTDAASDQSVFAGDSDGADSGIDSVYLSGNTFFTTISASE